MNRRAALRAAGALFGAGVAKLRAARHAQALAHAETTTAGLAAAGQVMAQAVPTDDGKRWDLFDALLRSADAPRRHRVAVAQLLGGYPPHLASMHSMAPWMRASLAARWAARQTDEGEAVAREIRKRVFGG